ncbi:MAG TPA: serine/threonine-protein kinase [Verrucomicrobiae bacterium]|jgi:serine/threonine protein kinase
MDTNRLCPSCQKPLALDVPMGLCPECLIHAGFPTGIDTDPGTARQPAFVPPTVGEIAKLFPQLEILELVGKGGMGAVYKARQKQLNRLVALKILPPGIGSEPAFAERFTREAQALARLNHPGIVTLYEFGETSGQFYFFMEFVDGMNLRQLLAGHRVSAREALAIVPQICDALQFAHDQGIVHRDIKPENILLDRRGRVKVADFGLAKLTGAESFGALSSAGPDLKPELQASLTGAGKIMGTPNYMAPEQVEHPGEVDNRADIYALGVVFYQMLTGELPEKKIQPPSAKVRMDVRLDEIVLRALEKKPELRYQHVSEVKAMVEIIVAKDTAPMTAPGRPQPSSQTMNTNIDKSLWRWAVVSLGVAACVALAGLAGHFLFQKQMLIGPANPGAEKNFDGWWVGSGGGAQSFLTVDHADPASGDSDFTLGNTNLDGNNFAEWRTFVFPLGPAANGSVPITFSFAYKWPEEVAAGDNVLVQLRFYGHATNFLGSKGIWLGSRSGDSAMTRYKTLTIAGIQAPPHAEMADITASINLYGNRWSSGTGRFDDFAVLAAPHSLLFKTGVAATALISICILIMRLVHFWRRSERIHQ